MEKYIGTKLVLAEPMNRREFNTYRNWELPADEDGKDKGYLVEYLDGGQANHPNHEGYISWSPEGVFANSYRKIAGMTFGQALEAVKAGQCVARAEWNGKNMAIYMVEWAAGYVPMPLGNGDKHGFYRHIADEGGTVPCIALYTAQGRVQMGWLASQGDMFADDWEVVASPFPQ
jgi:hypothetical protein